MKWHVFAMLVLMFMALAGIISIASATAPEDASTLARVLFFTALFALIWAGASLLSALFQHRANRKMPKLTSIKRAYFHGLLAVVLFATIAIIQHL